ncbi:MAG: ADOP family duplicated permease [Longimicrobiales bacterium]
MNLPLGPDPADEVRRELDAHIEERADELEAAGVTRTEAVRRAAAEFGERQGVERTMVRRARRRARRDRRGRVLGSLFLDLRVTIRGLTRQPGFALAAVLAMAVGVGGATAILSVVDGVLFRPLPYQEADRIVTLWATSPQAGGATSPSLPDFEDWATGSRTLESAAFIRGSALTHLDEADGARLVRTAFVGPDSPDVLAARMHLGSLSAFRDGGATEPVVALGYTLWRTRFQADSSVVGRVEPFAGRSYRVVGVLGPGVDYPPWAEAYSPLTPDAVEAQGLNVRGYRLDTRAVARLTPGATVDGVRAELAAIAAALAQRYPETNTGWGTEVRPLREHLLGDVRASLLVLLAAVAGLLLVACANVAGLGLARALDRAGELRLRAALGASRLRLGVLMGVESLFLAALGGALGVAAARLGVATFLAWGVPGLPRSQELGLDTRALVLALGVTTLAALLAGLAPAAVGSRTDTRPGPREGVRGRGGERVRAALVAVQVALTVAILAVTGLLARSFQALQSVDTGVEASGLVTLRMTLPAQYAGRPDLRAGLFDRVLAQARTHADIAAATVVNHAPVSGTGVVSDVRLPGPPAEVPPQAWVRTVGPDFFQVLGIPITAGRGLDADQHRAWTGAVVVSDELAGELWGAEDPVGRSLTLFRQVSSDPDFGQPLHATVVGVAGDTRSRLRSDGPTPAVYLPMNAHPWPSAYLVVRPHASRPVVGPIRDIVRSVEPEIPVAEVVAYETLARSETARDRFLTTLTAAFSVLSLVLALTGTYGVLAYSVRRRARAVAVQVALGSGRRRVVGDVLRRAAGLVGAGVAVGLVGALVATRFMESVLFGVSPLDPVALCGAALAVAVVGMAGAALPARRAARADPMALLRD